MALSITESIKGAPRSVAAAYAYRAGLNMVNSAEGFAYHNDFLENVATNVPVGFTAAIIDTGATITTATTATLGANGVIVIADATASEGAAAYLPRGVQLISGKKFFMEIRVRTDDVTDNTIQFGLTDLTATTNPEDLWTTTAANLVAFGILDGGSGATTMLTDAGNSGTVAQLGTRSLSANTWHTLAIGYDGVTLRGYVDGKISVTWSGVIPTAVALAPFVGHLNGDGGGAAVVLVDYLRFASQR